MDQRLGQGDNHDYSEGTPRNPNSSVLVSPLAVLVHPEPASLNGGVPATVGISDPSSRSMSTSVGQEGVRKESAIATACLACVNSSLILYFYVLVGGNLARLIMLEVADCPRWGPAGKSQQNRPQKRSKHLKCDGGNPCARCVSSGFECIYVASRRGYRGNRRKPGSNPTSRHSNLASPVLTSSSTNVSSEFPTISTAEGSTDSSTPTSTYSSPSVLQTATTIASRHGGALTQISQSRRPSFVSSSSIEHVIQEQPGQALQPLSFSERCIHSFYQNFHAAHPFVLPHQHLQQYSKETSMEPLLATIRWVGSIFLPDSIHVRQNLFDAAYRLIYAPDATSNGFLVQAMMILVVSLDGNSEKEKARQILGDVEAIALQIGLNTKAFASLNGRETPVLEESWRRTWWDLFIIDAMIAGVHRSTNFFLYDIPTDVPLPCEEHQYLVGTIPPSLPLEILDSIGLTYNERELSSFTYRIMSCQTLGKYMRLRTTYDDDSYIAPIEAMLTNWRLHLPATKKDAFQMNGRLDEMMFQAYMMNYAVSIMLHQPYSQLDTTPVQTVDSCTPQQKVQSNDLFNGHTKHIISSAGEISRMITQRVPLSLHTPFFTCVITLSSVVHLSRWATCRVTDDDETLRQEIKLNIGALSELSSTWRAAGLAYQQIRSVAHDIYKIKQQQHDDPQFWLGFPSQDVMNAISMNESIIKDIEGIEFRD